MRQGNGTCGKNKARLTQKHPKASAVAGGALLWLPEGKGGLALWLPEGKASGDTVPCKMAGLTAHSWAMRARSLPLSLSHTVGR